MTEKEKLEGENRTAENQPSSQNRSVDEKSTVEESSKKEDSEVTAPETTDEEPAAATPPEDNEAATEVTDTTATPEKAVEETPTPPSEGTTAKKEEAQEKEETEEKEVEPAEEISEETTPKNEQTEVKAEEKVKESTETPVDDASGQPEESSEEDEDEGSADDKELESEIDLKERDDHDDDHEDEHEEVDYSKLSKEELVDLIKDLAKDDRIMRSDKIAREIKHYFDEIHDHERQEALDTFIKEGGTEDDFDFKNDELTNRFYANFKLIRDRRSEHVKNREKQKENNLKRKQEILEKLREFVDSDETNMSFDTFKELQNEWKSIGQVPGAYAKTLWANYNALLDRFYDKRSIYFELKELDRRKNLESKNELVERAVKLKDMENLKDAIKELNELHHEFKHLGPVPKDEQEPLWQRFKAASDAVYERRKGYVEELKKELEENLEIKLGLIKEVESFLEFDSDRIKAWNAKTKDLIAIQKKWENTGGLPRAKAKAVNKQFWGAFKGFFNNKSAFFKKLDEKREGNLEKKQELTKKAAELRESTDWQKTANAFKALQRQWKEIGPVPEKHRESAYKEFKSHADYFFEKKRTQNKEQEKDFTENLKEKNEICDQIEKLAKEGQADLDKFRDLRDEFNAIGFVPRKDINASKKRYTEAVSNFIDSLADISDAERDKLRLENQISRIAQGPNADQKLYRKEQSIRKQIHQVENDISLWKNNMEFFADSKNADKLKDEFSDKITNATKELKQLKQQLKMIRST